MDPSVILVLFGSFARGEADSESDIDALLVHPNYGQELEGWSEGVEEWRRCSQVLTGNEVQLMAANQSEIDLLLCLGHPVW